MLYLFIIWDIIILYPDWSEIHRDPLASMPWVLGLKTSTIMTSTFVNFQLCSYPKLFYFRSFVFLCVHMCSMWYVCSCAHKLCACVWREEVDVMWLPQPFSLWHSDTRTLTLELTHLTGLWGSSCLCSQSTGRTDACPMPNFLCGTRDPNSGPALCNQYSPRWATSLISVFCMSFVIS